ncbi:Nicolin-1 [Amphibalanus amphitrite]|uniref:Nicolin-1 n=1 Tax=Amphibalanus amphitrite TaxID=1232801 RepID=A0A6A4WD37_AMPAM|nr:Nicolin-1 [Amphibalanus amphitrite]
MMQPREIVCTVDSPSPVTDSPHLAAGCLMQDVTLASPESLHEIRFRNFYVHSLSVWVQRAASEDVPPPTSAAARATRLGPWELSIRDRTLMPNPLYDTGSQDYVTISRKQSGVDWRGVVRLRFVLRQPVPHWRQFRLEEVRLLAPPSSTPGGGDGEEGPEDEWSKLVEATRAAVHADNGVQVFSGADGQIAYIGGSYDVQTLQLPDG